MGHLLVLLASLRDGNGKNAVPQFRYAAFLRLARSAARRCRTADRADGLVCSGEKPRDLPAVIPIVGSCNSAPAVMANWDLASLRRKLPESQPDLLQIIGSNDRTVEPERVAASFWNRVALAEFAKIAM